MHYTQSLQFYWPLMVGVLECTMGLLRLGWLIRFISHSVISGFTTASAMVIAFSQAKFFLGYSIDKTTKIIALMKRIISGISEVEGMEVRLSVSLENQGGKLSMSLTESGCSIKDIDIDLDGGASWLYQGLVDALVRKLNLPLRMLY